MNPLEKLCHWTDPAVNNANDPVAETQDPVERERIRRMRMRGSGYNGRPTLLDGVCDALGYREPRPPLEDE